MNCWYCKKGKMAKSKDLPGTKVCPICGATHVPMLDVHIKPAIRKPKDATKMRR